MYERIKKSRTARRDWPLALSLAGAGLALVLLILPLCYSMHIFYDFHRFAQDLAESFVYGEMHRTLTLTADGEESPLQKDRAEQVYALVVDTGMGHPRRSVPESGGLLLSFGDGSSLELWPAEIRESGRQNDTGVLFRFTRPNGRLFTYDTDRIQFESFARILLPAR